MLCCWRPASDLVRVADSILQGAILRFRAKSQSRSGGDVEKVVRLMMRSGQNRRGTITRRWPDATPRQINNYRVDEMGAIVVVF
jgi:hypothetical protein